MYTQFALLFLLIATGFLARKFSIIDEGLEQGLNKFIISIAFPCLILHRTGTLAVEDAVFRNFVIAALVYTGVLLLFCAYAYFYVRRRRFPAEDGLVTEFAIVSPNNGFMGFPIALAFFGNMGLLYMVACNLALNIMFFSYGVTLMKRGRDDGHSSLAAKILSVVKLVVLNTKILAAIAGMLLCYFQIALPAIIDEYLSMIGAIATPMAMVFIGSTLCGSIKPGLLRKPGIFDACLNRLIILPFLVLAALYFLPLDPMVKTAMILSTAMPVATTVPIFSQLYGRNKNLAGETLFVSTIFSMATIPLFIWIIHTIM